SLRERFRKWRRRHPKLTSATTIALLAGFLLLGLGGLVFMRGQRLAQLEAAAAQTRAQTSVREIERLLVGAPDTATPWQEGQNKCRQLIDAYQPHQPSWDRESLVAYLDEEARQKLREDLAMAMFLYAAAQEQQALKEKTAQTRQELARQALQWNEAARQVA